MYISRRLRGEVFNTKTSFKIICIEKGEEETLYSETLYKVTNIRKERKYMYFIHCQGNSKSKYSSPPFDGEASEKIIPLNKTGALGWLNANSLEDEYTEALEIEKNETEVFALYVSEALNIRLEQYFNENKNLTVKKFFENNIYELMQLEKEERRNLYKEYINDYSGEKKVRRSVRLGSAEKLFVEEEAKENNLFTTDIFTILIEKKASK